MTETSNLNPENGRVKDIDLAHEAAIAAAHDEEMAVQARRISERDKANGYSDGYERYKAMADSDERKAAEAANRVIGLAEHAEMEGLSNKEAVELLSYTDILDGDEARGAIEYTETSPNAQKYAAELQLLYEKHGWKKLDGLARDLQEKCLDMFSPLGIKPSKFAQSKSWALWDIAKQHYYFSHPNETSEQYTGLNRSIKLADPFEDTPAGALKRHEIVSRHLGWEADLAIREGRYSLDTLNRGL